MKKIGELSYTQRTATGADQSARTKIYVYVFGAQSEVQVTSDSHQLRFAWDILGYYEIVHPCLMADPWDELHGAFEDMVMRDLRENPQPGMYIATDMAGHETVEYDLKRVGA